MQSRRSGWRRVRRVRGRGAASFSSGLIVCEGRATGRPWSDAPLSRPRAYFKRAAPARRLAARGARSSGRRPRDPAGAASLKRLVRPRRHRRRSRHDRLLGFDDRPGAADRPHRDPPGARAGGAGIGDGDGRRSPSPSRSAPRRRCSSLSAPCSASASPQPVQLLAPRGRRPQTTQTPGRPRSATAR